MEEKKSSTQKHKMIIIIKTWTTGIYLPMDVCTWGHAKTKSVNII